MRVVVDSGVAVRLSLAGGSLGPLAGHELVGPPLLLSEATSVLHELARRGAIPPQHAQATLHHLLSLPIRIEHPADLHTKAWDLAESLGWAKTYDAEYVALSVLLDATLVTLDDRLRRGAGHVTRILPPDELPTG